MKKLFILFALILSFTVINAQFSKFPVGVATVITKTDTAGTVALGTFQNTLTYVNFTDTVDAMTWTAASGTGLMNGSEVVIKVKAGGTTAKTITLGTGITGAAISLTATKTYLIKLYWNGTTFYKSQATLVD